MLVEFAFQLGPAQGQHAAQLVERDSVQEPPGLGQGEPEILQRHDPVEQPQLTRRVAAVPGVRVYRGRPQQPDLVVVPERADRYAADPGELADAEHDTKHAALTLRESQGEFSRPCRNLAR